MAGYKNLADKKAKKSAERVTWKTEQSHYQRGWDDYYEGRNPTSALTKIKHHKHKAAYEQGSQDAATDEDEAGN